MNKNEFLARLRSALVSLPFEEGQSAVKYYEEYFADAGEDREDEIVKELGSPEMLAATILGGFSSPPARTSDVRGTAGVGYADVGYNASASGGYSSERSNEPWYRRTPIWVLIILVVCLSPLILAVGGALLGLLGGLFGVAIGIIAAVAGVLVSGIAFGIGGIIMVIVGVIRLIISPAAGIITAGVGLVMLGVGILLALATIWIFTHTVPAVARFFVNLLRRIFNRGGASE